MNKQKLVSPILMWLVVATGVVLVWRFLPWQIMLFKNSFTPLLIFPAVIYWFYFLTSAIKVHRRAAKSAAAIEKIVTVGVYARLRHPIYSADLALAWGVFFFLPELKIFLSVIWLTAVLLFWLKLEEWALIKKFGSEYEEYKKRTPLLLPRFFKK